MMLEFGDGWWSGRETCLGRALGCLDFDDPPFAGLFGGGGEGNVESECLSSEEGGEPSSESEERTTWAFRLRPGRDIEDEEGKGGEGRRWREKEQTRLVPSTTWDVRSSSILVYIF